MITSANRQNALWFILPSLVGLLLFIAPVPQGDGGVTIPVALVAGGLQDSLAAVLPWLAVILTVISVVGALAYRALPEASQENRLVKALFKVTPGWLLLRVVGMVLSIMIIFELGPEWIWGENTGGLILSLATTMVAVFLIAGFLLPLLLDFGLLEFVGVMLHKVMRPVFKVPGRSSVDCLASWVGDATIGVLMTNQQYVQGQYTKREAAVLGTTFSVVSITFTIVILEQLGLQSHFGAFYATIVIAGLVAAVIMPRIPPLSLIPDEYVDGRSRLQEDGSTAGPDEAGAEGAGNTGLVGRAWNAALDRASGVRLPEVVRNGASNVLEMWVGIIPVILAVGTTAVVIAENTPLFTWLGAPFVPALELMGLPDAQVASETLFVGFADMLLPALIATDVSSELTRFVVGALSVTQLIFMSEVGGLLLASKIPVRFYHLVAIFLLRTLITLPIIIALAHLFL